MRERSHSSTRADQAYCVSNKFSCARVMSCGKSHFRACQGQNAERDTFAQHRNRQDTSVITQSLRVDQCIFEVSLYAVLPCRYATTYSAALFLAPPPDLLLLKKSTLAMCRSSLVLARIGRDLTQQQGCTGSSRANAQKTSLRQRHGSCLHTFSVCLITRQNERQPCHRSR